MENVCFLYLPQGASLYNELKNEHLINVYDVNYKEDVAALKLYEQLSGAGTI